jgi:hypothetical protein
VVGVVVAGLAEVRGACARDSGAQDYRQGPQKYLRIHYTKRRVETTIFLVPRNSFWGAECRGRYGAKAEPDGDRAAPAAPEGESHGAVPDCATGPSVLTKHPYQKNVPSV